MKRNDVVDLLELVEFLNDAIFGRFFHQSTILLELVEFLNDAIFPSRESIALGKLELVEFLNDAIFNASSITSVFCWSL